MADNQFDKEEAAAFIKQLKELYEAGKYKEAVEVFGDFLSEYKDKGFKEFSNTMNEVLLMASSFNHKPVARIHYINGLTYNELKKYEKAIIDFSKAIELDSAYVDAYYNRGCSYYELKQYEKAILDFSKVIDMSFTYINAYDYRAHCYTELQQYEKGIKDFSQVIDLDATYVHAYNYRGYIYNKLKQYEKAIEDFSKVIELDSSNVYAYSSRGHSFNKFGKYEKAVEDFSKAIELDPTDSYAYDSIGYSYYKLNQLEKSTSYFSKAIELNPRDDSAYRNRADVYDELKQYDKAIEDYSRIVEYSQDDFFINLAKSKLEEIEKQKDAEEYKPISDLVTEIKDLLIFKDSRVTHYSGLSTVRPLVFDNSKFRLSEGSFLNDTSEGRILFHFLEVEQQAKNESIAEMFIEKPFIGSFVADTKSDDLTLWRMYGKEAQEEAKGCSITMDSKKFLEDLNAAYIPENKEIARDIEKEDIFQFFRVAYLTNDKEQKFIIPSESEAKEQALNELMGRLKHKIKDINLGSIKEKTAQNIKEKLAEVAYLFKSIEYQYEHEVRLIVSLSTLFKRKINTNRTPPGVYIELVDILPSVCRITLGPKVVLAEEWAAALHYDITNKGHQAEVFVSHLPYK